MRFSSCPKAASENQLLQLANTSLIQPVRQIAPNCVPIRGGTRAADAALSAKDAAAERMLDRIKDLIFKVLSWVLPASTLAELRVLYHIAMHPIRGDTHKERLESFYGSQAADYDDFRKKLLSGREQMVQDATQRAGGGIWVDMGAGTGANLAMVGDEVVMSFAKIYLVDMSPSLLAVARKRCEDNGWHNVEVVEGDATTWEPDEGLGHVDLVTFSYSLTMIPDWFAAMDNANALLASDGTLGVVDFYVARKHPDAGLHANGWLQRTFWPAWFANDNVFLSADHVPYLRRIFPSHTSSGSSRTYIPCLQTEVSCQDHTSP